MLQIQESLAFLLSASQQLPLQGSLTFPFPNSTGLWGVVPPSAALQSTALVHEAGSLGSARVTSSGENEFIFQLSHALNN